MRAHPLLYSDRDDGTPRTPRGPAPPWAAAVSSRTEPVDRTSTGCTPPPRIRPQRSPPGLPEEQPSEAEALPDFGSGLLREFLAAARAGETATLGLLLQRLQGEAHRALHGAGPKLSVGAAVGNMRGADGSERVGEAVASFLNAACTPEAGEPLLSVAARGGYHEAVQLLLESRTDPFVQDKSKRTALHVVAASKDDGALLTALLLLDRMQDQHRSLRLADLADAQGETPQLTAAGGSSEVRRALDLFSAMQIEAELRRVGSCDGSFTASEAVGTVGLVVPLDMASSVASPAGFVASAALRRVALGTGIVSHISRRASAHEAELRRAVEVVCQGLHRAETLLLETHWCPEGASTCPWLQRFSTTAAVRSSWQKTRSEAVNSLGREHEFDDFAQTHMGVEAMAATLAGTRGDSFQILLIVLWLYTREAWLPHILDSLAVAVAMEKQARPSAEDGSGARAADAEGTTGATPMFQAPFPLQQLQQALAPFAQLVQDALNYFEDRGIRHEADTFRPIHMSDRSLDELRGRMSLVQNSLCRRKLLDQGMSQADVEAEHGCEAPAPWTAGALAGDVWLSLGANSFFSAMSVRTEAVERLWRTRCNVMLVIRPDKTRASYPKHLALRCSCVDDVLFPLGALFRVLRITSLPNDEFAENFGVAMGSDGERRPITVLEIASCARTPEILEVLERRGELQPGELERNIEDWAEFDGPTDQHLRLLTAGELLLRAPTASGNGSSKSRVNSAIVLLERAAARAATLQDPIVQSCALLASARCRAAEPGCEGEMDTAVGEARRAVALLEDTLGKCHPEVCAARAVLESLTG